MLICSDNGVGRGSSEMIVGIMSDSHGRSRAVAAALAVFDDQDVGAIIHCGDVGGMEVFDLLVGRTFHFVWGNCDVCDGALLANLDTVGLAPPGDVPLRLDLDGKRFAVLHGHEPEAANVLKSGEFDYVLHGHSHVARDERVGGTRIVNPGALFRAATLSVAVLDTATDALRFHEIA